LRTRLRPRGARALAALFALFALFALASTKGIGAQEGRAAADRLASTQVLPADSDAPRLRPERFVRPIQGRATRVYDGDSFALLGADGRRLQIRISGIDAPEKGQAFADRSRRHLSQLLLQKDLLITPIKTDVYGRIVAVVSADEQDIGLAQLRAGLAWHFLRYARDQSVEQRQAYARAEAEAREARVGLWRDREPLEPWRFREKQRGR
jgi:endonuclease YncB( thermonuclease family)